MRQHVPQTLRANLLGARILELGEWGIRPASWNQLELVAEWREFLREPQSFIRHLLDDETNCGSFSG
jgi:hypothetical protein